MDQCVMGGNNFECWLAAFDHYNLRKYSMAKELEVKNLKVWNISLIELLTEISSLDQCCHITSGKITRYQQKSTEFLCDKGKGIFFCHHKVYKKSLNPYIN